MRLNVTKPVDIEVECIRILAPVRYDEEDIPKDFPFRRAANPTVKDEKHSAKSGYDVWDVVVLVDDGRILDWPAGVEADLHMKVTDCGSYYLLGEEGRELAAIHEDYVPGCIPGSYGDYIEFKIGGDGTVANWSEKWIAADVQDAFFRTDD